MWNRGDILMIQHSADLLRFCSIPQTTIFGPLRVEHTHPLAAPLRGTHNHHKRALCDLCHVAADRSNFAGRNPVNVIKSNKIERNLVRMRLNLCISFTLSGSNHKKIALFSFSYFPLFLLEQSGKRTRLMNRKWAFYLQTESTEPG